MREKIRERKNEKTSKGENSHAELLAREQNARRPARLRETRIGETRTNDIKNFQSRENLILGDVRHGSAEE